MVLQLTGGDARALAITAQGLAGRRHRDPLRLLRELSAIQIDTISVMARSHELVGFARLGPVTRDDLVRAWWGRARTFEYWAHAACLVPLELWPLFAWRRRRYQRRHPRVAEHEQILAQVRDAGAVTIADLGGARTAGGPWEWSPVKRAVEQLLARGEVVCTERRGFHRVYRLAATAIPPELLAQDPDDATCFARLVGRAAAHMGVATEDDLADYFRMPVVAVRPAAEAAGLIACAVPGWHRPAWAHPAVTSGPPRRVRHRPVLLSPFDSLIWHRARTRRLFGFRHRLEAYTPAAQREHGYFVMPLLAGGRLVGRVDPKRDGEALTVRALSVEKGAVPAMAEALAEAARWVGCTRLVLADRVPADVAVAIRRALTSMPVTVLA